MRSGSIAGQACSRVELRNVSFYLLFEKVTPTLALLFALGILHRIWCDRERNLQQVT